jgi:hypothetical protein
VAYWKYYRNVYLERLRKIAKDHIQDSWKLGGNFNRVSLGINMLYLLWCVALFSSSSLPNFLMKIISIPLQSREINISKELTSSVSTVKESLPAR